MDFYYNHRVLMLVVAVALPLVLSLAHYLAVGPKGGEFGRLPRTVKRLTLADRLVHALRIVAFFLVAVTGYVMAFGSARLGDVHKIWGIVFVAGGVLALLLWSRHSLPKPGDGRWLLGMGGYLSKKATSYRAGKFNAGQKGFIWLTVALGVAMAGTGMWLDEADRATSAFSTVLAVHGLLAAVIVLLVVAHVYLSVFALPGTWRVLLRGRVAPEWLAHHHPDDPSASQR